MANYIRIEVKADNPEQARAKVAQFQGFTPNFHGVARSERGTYFVGGDETSRIAEYPDLVSVWEMPPHFLHSDHELADAVIADDDRWTLRWSKR